MLIIVFHCLLTPLPAALCASLARRCCPAAADIVFTPQALLYLVPCTLGVVLLLALSRGELHLLLDASLDPSHGDSLEVDATDRDGGPDGLLDGPGEQQVALLAGQQGSRSSSGGSTEGGAHLQQQQQKVISARG
jgi:hypothetical protein